MVQPSGHIKQPSQMWTALVGAGLCLPQVRTVKMSEMTTLPSESLRWVLRREDIPQRAKHPEETILEVEISHVKQGNMFSLHLEVGKTVSKRHSWGADSWRRVRG